MDCFHHRPDGNGYRLRNAEVRIGNSPVNSSGAAVSANPLVWKQNFIATDGQVIKLYPGGAEGRWVSLQNFYPGTDNYVLHVAEMQVFGEAAVPGTLNWARSRAVYASSFATDLSWCGGLCSRSTLVDGDVSTRWTHSAVGDLTPWLAVDLGMRISVALVVIFDMPDDYGFRLRNSEVRIGDTPVNRSGAAVSANPLVWKQTGIAANGQVLTVYAGGAEGRWVSLQNFYPGTDDYILHVAEMQPSSASLPLATTAALAHPTTATLTSAATATLARPTTATLTPATGASLAPPTTATLTSAATATLARPTTATLTPATGASLAPPTTATLTPATPARSPFSHLAATTVAQATIASSSASATAAKRSTATSAKSPTTAASKHAATATDACHTAAATTHTAAATSTCPTAATTRHTAAATSAHPTTAATIHTAAATSTCPTAATTRHTAAATSAHPTTAATIHTAAASKHAAAASARPTAAATRHTAAATSEYSTAAATSHAAATCLFQRSARGARRQALRRRAASALAAMLAAWGILEAAPWLLSDRVLNSAIPTALAYGMGAATLAHDCEALFAFRMLCLFVLCAVGAARSTGGSLGKGGVGRAGNGAHGLGGVGHLHGFALLHGGR
ncbi:hypothetical protein HYH03_013409 [Edaphochlamys debaryana]|uniref:F5/8 type C domain-containing protein n=1 Tax=Edaphochlamys debaryana TaxID=47281 RepID=A0A835XYF9_9CHLO|nr:hypothetical protein HYH03_013409 [Edaphochlamys debaryana]|eukprot:KAG2487969.1 hypothetical protein HYH03_013409 [Edaphochlamys debaryana]